MHAKVEVKDLSIEQFEMLDAVLMTGYEFPGPDSTRLCVVFTGADGERHAEMPAAELGQTLHVLETVERGSRTLNKALGR